jgi:hypothetical protein
MDEIKKIRRLLRIDNLEALLILCEIEHAGLNFEIDSPQAAPQRRAEAIAQRDAVIIKWGRIMTELEELRNSSDVLQQAPDSSRRDQIRSEKMNVPKGSSKSEDRVLSTELCTLSRLQFDALQRSAYPQMSQDEANAYDKRRSRIEELCDLLAKVRIRKY